MRSYTDSGHAYIASGVVLTPEHEDRLSHLGFKKMTKAQKGHEHIWWEISSKQVKEFFSALANARRLVNLALGIKTNV